MTSFQVKCIDGFNKFFKEALQMPHLEFGEIVGKREAYFKTAFDLSLHKFEIYVYLDESGFMIDGHDWTICERPDYPNEEDLIKAIISKLQKKISFFQPAA